MNKTEDLISRQAVIDAVRGWVNKAFEDWGNAETEIRCFNEIYSLIEALPSIDAILLGVEYNTNQFQVNLMANAEDHGDYRILNQRFVVERK